MPDSDPLGLDPTLGFELRTMGRNVVVPAVERNFGDDTAAEFNAANGVEVPATSRVEPGETVAQAHLRIQTQNNNGACE